MTHSAEELIRILELHRKWLRNEEGGSRADLSGADLSRADLSRADLSGADLSRADLSRADLSRADLSGADLSRADLSGADLSRADLSRADLSRADLSGADLSRADLSGADLSRADLSGADLSRADLENISPFAICPEQGAFIGFKKAYCSETREKRILTLEIQADALRVSTSIGRKCRASCVRVLSAEDMDGVAVTGPEFHSGHDSDFKYRIGEIASVDDFDDDIRVECTRGIHFFITKAEAKSY